MMRAEPALENVHKRLASLSAISIQDNGGESDASKTGSPPVLSTLRSVRRQTPLVRDRLGLRLVSAPWT